MTEIPENSSTPRDNLVWMTQAHGLLKIWNSVEEIYFKNFCDLMAMEAMRYNLTTRIFSALHRVVADHEFEVAADAEIKSGSVAVHTFFQALKKVIASAEKSLFIIDPYIDDTVLDYYLNSRQVGVSVRLLLDQYPKNVKTAIAKYTQEFGSVLEARRSQALHDRVIYIDCFVCWVIGKSLKDTAKSIPTHLVPLPPDTVADKLQDHEKIWEEADAI